jgi:hypothetical protein
VNIMAQAEILQAINHLHAALADLAVRGLRSVAPAQLAPLASLQEEFERIGADHLASRIRALVEAIRTQEPSAAAALLRTQTSLRLFERILTVEHASQLLAALADSVEDEA